jgi:Dienelactone hydrolase family
VPGVLRQALTAAGVGHDIKVYHDAGHGFLNDHDPDDLSPVDKVIAKLAAATTSRPRATPAAVSSPSSAPISQTCQRTREPLQLGMFLGQLLERLRRSDCPGAVASLGRWRPASAAAKRSSLPRSREDSPEVAALRREPQRLDGRMIVPLWHRPCPARIGFSMGRTAW